MSNSADRSVQPKDYQNLPPAIVAMVKHYEDGHVTPPHAHERDQFLYAGGGLMKARTETEAWMVPPDRAVYIPAGTHHTVSMHGDVTMCTLYITPRSSPGLPIKTCVLHVHNLLRELILALGKEPVVYESADRAGLIARLIAMEIRRAPEMALYIPLPGELRLRRLCSALLADPSSKRTLDEWAEMVGGSTRTLSRLFEKELGISFSNWRRRVRFYSALEALSLGEPVGIVARNHGYKSISAFSAAFRKTLGIRPSEIQNPNNPGRDTARIRLSQAPN